MSGFKLISRQAVEVLWKEEERGVLFYGERSSLIRRSHVFYREISLKKERERLFVFYEERERDMIDWRGIFYAGTTVKIGLQLGWGI